MIPEKLADGERENLSVGLSKQGNAYSWIQLCPRFKIDKDGDPILTNSEMFLKFMERSSEYVHCAEITPAPGRFREVNCSLESSSWKMTIFESSLDSASSGDGTRPKYVMASQLISINDPETKCNLTVAHSGVATLEEVPDDDGSFVHDYGNIVLEPAVDNFSSGMLWFIESKTLVTGGSIRWRTEQVRFRHLNSGYYLRLLNERVVNSEGELTEEFALATTRDGTSPDTLFNVEDLVVTSKVLSYDKPVRIGREGIWIERGEVLEDLSYVARGCSEVDRSVNFKLQRYVEDTDPAEKEPFAIYSGLSIRTYLSRYLHMTVIPNNNFVSTIWPSGDRTDLDFFGFMMEKAVNFSQGFDISATDINLEVDKADNATRIKRQILLRDQGTLEILLRLIHILQPISNKSDEAPKLSKGAKLTEEEQSLLRMGKGVLEKCFLLLLWSLTDNAEIQMYIADHMPVLLSHLGGQPLAGRCVTEMLTSNMELQETKIGTREITIFVDKLRASKMNSMYLQLLMACCSCQGNGIDGNQCKVTDLLFSNTNDVIINLNCDYGRRSMMDWVTHEMYIPPTPIPGSPVAAEVLLTKGLPRLSLAWTTNSIDFSPLGLFGKLSVNVEELYAKAPLAATENFGVVPAKKANAKKNVSKEQKASVARYFVAQMMLSAEMCMDRNYVAMHTLDNMFPYEVLLTILKLDVTDNLKAASARLLLCLHIDRDPQAETKIPCFTRAWSEVQKSADSEPKLPSVEPSRRHIYGILQQIISEHLREMAGQRWSILSRHMLQLLKKMVAFNFYGTNERMLDVIRPLVEALDRRTINDDMSAANALANSANIADKDNSTNDVVGESDKVAFESTLPEVAEGGGVDGDCWQKRTLEFMESIKVMMYVMCLVLVSVALSVYEVIVPTHTTVTSPLYLVGLIITFIFIVEVSLRAYCYVVTRDTLLSFLRMGFNQIDILVILIDLVFIGLPADVANGSKFAKVLRLVRLIRLMRVLRAARVISTVVKAMEENKVAAWKVPVRFSKCPQHELVTMVEAVEILQLAQNVIDDRNITLLLKYFHLWECEKDRRTPGQIFEQVISDSDELTLGNDKFDNVFIDAIMFNNSSLVQSSLELLMSFHSTRRSLLENAAHVQLLVSAKRERQFKIVDQMLQQLERNAETHELWGELKTDADYAISKQTKDIMEELADVCKVRRKVLEFDEEFMADSEIQNLFRNLGCFSICFKVLGLLDSVEEDENGEVDEVGANTRQLCVLCNHLLYWFFLANPLNQELGYSELDFFLGSLDAKINSHMVVRSIFKMNERLMKLVPHSHLRSMTEKICKAEPDDRSPHDLALMLAITHIPDKGMRENQVEIMRQLTSPGRAQKISCFFVPVTDPEYEIKRSLMLPYANVKDISMNDLPPLLAYHLNLLELFSGCTVGRIGGITSIEAKAQAVFAYEDAIDSILHPDTILLAKIRLSQFIFNAVIEVEMMIVGLEHSACIWKLLEEYDHHLSTSKADFIAVREHGWLHTDVSRQRIEYHLIAIMVVGGFFAKYFDITTFRLDDKSTSENTGRVKLTSQQLKELIFSLLTKIATLDRIDWPFLEKHHKVQISEAVAALQKSTSKEVVVHLEPGDLGNQLIVAVDDDQNVGLEAHVLNKYVEFLNALNEDPEVLRKSQEQNMEFIQVLENIPFIADEVEADIRQETLFRKLVLHIRENMVVINSEKRMDARCTKTTMWLIKAFRTMIENRMGMTIYERDDDGGEEQDVAVAPVVAAMNACGATTLCVDLIAVGIDSSLQLEAAKLCVGMLFKEGGAIEVQEILNTHLSTTNSEYFFRQMHLTIQKLIEWHKWHDVIQLEEGEEPNLPDELIFIRFLQLMSEGHYLPNQDIVREQPHNANKFNLLDDLVAYLGCLSRLHCRTSTNASIRVAATILEVIQGPCTESQFHFTMKTELLETLNRIMRAKVVLDCVAEEEIELKKTAVDIFQGLLEGQPLKSVVYERLLSVIHLDVILLLSGSVRDDEEGADTPAASTPEVELSDDEEVLKTECVVLLQMLCDCKPSIRDEFGLSNNLEDIMKSGTSCIEVVWRGALQRRFFHVPAICSDMAKSSMDRLVEEVDRSNLENQLLDFIDRSREIYREIKHQQVLRSLGLSLIFSKNNHDKVTWFTFLLSWVLNFLLILFLSFETGKPIMPVDITLALYIIGYIHAFCALVSLVLIVVIQSPVTFQSLEESGLARQWVFVYTATEPIILYYVFYLLLSLLGVFLKPYYLAFLLLDIVMKNAITRAVMNAVVTPRVQLMWSMILGIIAIYIYSFYIVSWL